MDTHQMIASDCRAQSPGIPGNDGEHLQLKDTERLSISGIRVHHPRDLHPTVSEWLLSMTQCEYNVRYWARTPRTAILLKEWSALWLERGQPEIAWPEKVESPDDLERVIRSALEPEQKFPWFVINLSDLSKKVDRWFSRSRFVKHADHERAR